MEIIRVILTALLSVAALFIITKIMGHKQVAQLDFFDYVCGITIGSIGAELATELEEPYKPLVALGVYGLVSLTLNLLAHKIPRTRKYINGTPSILMNEGKIYRKNLKKAKIDLSEFMLLCREQGYFDLEEIHFYVNKCGFMIDQFWCEHFQPDHEMLDEDERDSDEGPDEMFRFIKVMKNK